MGVRTMPRSAWAARLLLVTALVACDGDPDLGGAGADRTSATSVEVTVIPGRFLEECQQNEWVARACPRVLPLTTSRYRGGLIDFGSGSFSSVYLSASAPYEGRPTRNRPPRFSHVVIEAGAHRAFVRLAASGEVVEHPARAWPGDQESLLFRPRRNPVLLAERTWGDRPGRLFLFPGYPVGGIHGDHLVFLWQEGEVDRAVSLHAWSPIEESIATLQAMVESIPAS
jgi:hypothetical protein